MSCCSQQSGFHSQTGHFARRQTWFLTHEVDFANKKCISNQESWFLTRKAHFANSKWYFWLEQFISHNRNFLPLTSFRTQPSWFLIEEVRFAHSKVDFSHKSYFARKNSSFGSEIKFIVCYLNFWVWDHVCSVLHKAFSAWSQHFVWAFTIVCQNEQLVRKMNFVCAKSTLLLAKWTSCLRNELRCARTQIIAWKI